jgi:hypothetical protein
MYMPRYRSYTHLTHKFGPIFFKTLNRVFLELTCTLRRKQFRRYQIFTILCEHIQNYCTDILLHSLLAKVCSMFMKFHC